MLDRFKLFGYGAQLPDAVRAVLRDYSEHLAAKSTIRDRQVLIVQAIVALILVLGLAFHIAEVGLIGLVVIILATTFTGIVEEHRIGKAFESALPFTALLVVFFVIVAGIHDQHLFEPVIRQVLALEGRAQAAALYLATGVLSTISDNVFVASIYITEIKSVLLQGGITREQFDAAGRGHQHRDQHPERRDAERPGGVPVPADVDAGAADPARLRQDGLDGAAVFRGDDGGGAGGGGVPAVTHGPRRQFDALSHLRPASCGILLPKSRTGYRRPFTTSYSLITNHFPMPRFNLRNLKIGVVGLGYVGLPLAVEFGKRFTTVGFDIKAARVDELRKGHDSTLETDEAELASATKLSYTTKLADLKSCRVFIVTVPTPIDEYKRPDLTPLVKSSEAVGQVLKKGDVVVYESTVYPGCTEEVCVPILERVSGLKFNKDFFAGYSPERINPGDKQHRLTTIRKVTSGSTPAVAEFVDSLYRSIVVVGTHKASSIKVAEAAKVIENTQRDVNIALINELALIFNRMGIDTEEVLNAAGSKWNFLPFRPGLVGGHCIGVDPYYLTHKAQAIGYHPEMILAGRRINDNMGTYVAQQIAQLMIQRRIQVKESRILIMGLTFKENCPDVRNTKIVDVVHELEKFGANVDVFDPWADADEAEHEYGLRPVKRLKPGTYDAVVMGVAHQQFRDMGIAKIRELAKKEHVLYDIKYVFRADEVDGRL